jgi:hypothetical protein
MTDERSYADRAVDALKRAEGAYGVERSVLIEEALRYHRLAMTTQAQSDNPVVIDFPDPSPEET